MKCTGVCVCVEKEKKDVSIKLFYGDASSSPGYRFVMINGQKDIIEKETTWNSKLGAQENNKQTGEIPSKVFCPKNVDSLCRFHVPFFVCVFFHTQKFPIEISHRFRMFAVFTHFWDLFCRFRILPPSKKKKRSSTDRRPRSYKVCYVDDCVTKY